MPFRIGIVGLHLLAALALVSAVAVLVPTPAEAGGIPEGPNGIVFKIKTSQGIGAHILYRERAKKNTVSVGVDVVMSCTNDFGPFTRRLDEVVEGRPKGNSFNGSYTNPLSTPPSLFETATASVSFRPGGSKGGLPRWRKATGTVRFTTAADLFDNEKCDSGPISFVTTSSHLAKLVPIPGPL